MTLTIAKRDTVDRLLSKALTDNQISDSKFQLLMAEFSQHNVLKDAVRAKLTRQSSRPDVEKIKKNVRSEMEAEFQKKINCSRCRIELTHQKFNLGFYFSVTKSRVTLRDASRKKKNPRGKVLGGYLFALPQQGLPAADKAAVGSHLSSEHLPSYVLGQSGLTRGYHRTLGLTPYS